MKNILNLLFLLLFPVIQAQESNKADLVILNANIITVDDTKPHAEAMAIKGEHILFVGSNKEVSEFIAKNTKVEDAKGKTIVPGFFDAHLHIREIYPFSHRLATVNLTPDSIKNMDDLIAVLKRKAAITPEGQWIMGGGYEDTKLGRHPTRYDLDKVSTKHPISIRHSSGHVGVVNSFALNMANITSKTADPAGGAYDRDEKGEPNGICREGASRAIYKAGPKQAEATEAEAIEGLMECCRRYMSQGITSAADAGNGPEQLSLYQKAHIQGLQFRITMMVSDRYFDTYNGARVLTGFGDDFVKIGAIKVFHGNSLSGRTCWLKQPYDKINPKTGKKDYYGIPPARSQAQLDSAMDRYFAAGYQIATHSNGDREIEMVLNAYEKAMKNHPRANSRLRIEHCSVVDSAILKKIKELDVVIVPHSYIYEHGDKMEEYGENRWNMMHPNGSAVAMNIHVAGHSDSPVSPAIPLLRIQSMVTNTSKEGKLYGPAQRVSATDALRIWTMGSTYACFEENKRGSLTEGKLADFVVLSDDLTKVDPFKIKDIKVEKTFIGGKLAFSNN